MNWSISQIQLFWAYNVFYRMLFFILLFCILLIYIKNLNRGLSRWALLLMQLVTLISHIQAPTWSIVNSFLNGLSLYCLDMFHNVLKNVIFKIQISFHSSIYTNIFIFLFALNFIGTRVIQLNIRTWNIQ